MDHNKFITLNDRINPVDRLLAYYGEKWDRKHKSCFRTEITATNEFGEVLFKNEHNETVIGGAITVLEKLYGIGANLKVASINNIMGINDIVALSDSSASKEDFITLWGVGIGGSGDAFGDRKAVKFYERELGQNGHSDQMIPFRIVSAPFASTDDNFNKYYMMRQREDSLYEYYLKAFEITPVIKVLWRDGAEGEDGSEVDSDVYKTNRTDDIDVFSEMICKISNADLGEYFEKIGQVDMARINSIGLFTGRRVEISDGRYDYTNVKLFSKLNMDNEPLQQSTGTRTITLCYRLFVC